MLSFLIKIMQLLLVETKQIKRRRLKRSESNAIKKQNIKSLTLIKEILFREELNVLLCALFSYITMFQTTF